MVALIKLGCNYNFRKFLYTFGQIFIAHIDFRPTSELRVSVVYIGQEEGRGELHVPGHCSETGQT